MDTTVWDADVAAVAAALEMLVATVEMGAEDPMTVAPAVAASEPEELDEVVEEEEEEGAVVRFAASKVALLVGLHEFGDVGEAVMEYVYQDREELLVHDARALDLRIVSKDDELQELVAKTGTALAPQLEEIISWTRDRRREPVTQGAADALLQSVDGLVTQAHGKRKLQAEEAEVVKRQLSERIRQSYGCRNEDLALKTYEQQTGSTVRLSNQEFYTLEFPRVEASLLADIDFGAVEGSIVAVRGTRRTHRRRRGQPQQQQTAPEECKEQEGEGGDDNNVSTSAPYFTICGMIDGVVDALEIAGEDDWQLVPILLEVKNRMRAFRVPPPLYDYIQMAVYLKMVGLRSGDLIQCLHADRAQIHVTRVSLGEYPLRCTSTPMGSSASNSNTSDGFWSSVLLPRLYAIVKTIEHLRGNDLLRLAFLNCSEGERLEILRRECDFL